jgi:hypothetical protein
VIVPVSQSKSHIKYGFWAVFPPIKFLISWVVRWPEHKSGYCCPITEFTRLGRIIRHLVVLAARYSSAGETFYLCLLTEKVVLISAIDLTFFLLLQV